MTTNNMIETIPVAPLKIMTLDGFRPLAEKVNSLIVNARHNQALECKNLPAFNGYEADTYLVDAACPRFNSGEAKGIIRESIHGTDLYILADVTNNNINYSLDGMNNMMSPDDHFQDLKRLIDACNGKAHRINVIIPFLYEGRQHKRTYLESLDCATALQELVKMGVKNIITFDALDPRVQNAIPIDGFDNFYTSYQFIQALLATEKGLKLDSEHLMIISPDESVMSKAIFYTNILGVDMGMFYKKHDYTENFDVDKPVSAYEFLGTSVEGKDVLIVADAIFTGRSILNIALELKRRKASKIYIAATFGLFTDGYGMFDKYVEEGIIDRVFTTNLVYCSPELLAKKYYTNVDLSRYLALIIHTINHDQSVDGILDSTTRIQDIVADYKRNN
ncbi:ribose-phosphate pyrophosphokinase [Anaerocolumna sp. AGMB13025]|uniref:ribose-phosphate pyrophosphokinase n=1 Tax=Anaerocolumna sp. AGMB13025 TaxID=3039116 RepID=UPI00241C45C5|nr:ribose-phosphate pyrophosphokinase [Anaerocolumna sp. AGMB13025]WFR54809.1 ribose-phosphate pyrophosphokinase [Anaerocolumna sp. AGMB13025]